MSSRDTVNTFINKGITVDTIEYVITLGKMSLLTVILKKCNMTYTLSVKRYSRTDTPPYTDTFTDEYTGDCPYELFAEATAGDERINYDCTIDEAVGVLCTHLGKYGNIIYKNMTYQGVLVGEYLLCATLVSDGLPDYLYYIPENISDKKSVYRY